jgi:hypothetical protein
MTIEKFQQLYAISQLEVDEVEKSIMYVQSLTGKTEKEIESMSIKQFNKVCSKASAAFNLKESLPKRIIYANSKAYLMDYEPKNAGRYVEVSTFIEDTIPNLHKIMASMSVHIKWSWRKMRLVPVPYDATKHEDYANDWLKADFKAAYSTALFFCNLYKESIKALQPYLIREAKMKGIATQTISNNLTDLLNILDGFAQPKRLVNLKK